jgi:haloalkane dehalogenase
MRSVPCELYPFEGKHLEVGGLRMHCLEEGQGDAVVCVHGNPTWSLYYRRLVEALRGSHRVVAPDHIGCGLSEKPGDDRYPFTLGRRIDDLEELIERLELGDVTLVVHDWGGAIGLGWAVRHPERVRRLVILNTAAFHLPRGKAMPWQLTLVRDTPLGALLVRGLNAFARGATRAACTRVHMPRALRDAYCAPYDSWAARLAVLRFVQDIPLAPGDPSFDELSRIEAGLEAFVDRPALVLWGGRDFVFDHHFLEEWRRRLPAAEVHEFPDCGHYLLEDAAEEVIPRIERFLRAHSQ